jgi:2-oxoglutarate dehydrogenase E2 component (dihydrolipoamide succinyltransferase)
MSVSLVMPSLGESVIEGTVTKWLVREGDTVAREQPVVSVATDKADSDVPATQSGRISKILAAEGSTVKVGEPLCEIDVTGATVSEMPPPPVSEPPATSRSEPPPPRPGVSKRRSVPPPSRVPQELKPASEPEEPTGDNGSGRGRSSPVVRKLALEHGVDLDRVQGSGARGRVTPEDVIKAAERSVEREELPAPEPAPLPVARIATTPAVGLPVSTSPLAAGASQELAALLSTGVKFPVPNSGYGSYRVPSYRPKEGDQVVPFSRRRRLTADHMVYSKLTAPHVVTVAEVDLFKTSKLREANKDRYKKEGTSLTMLAFVCAAIVRALREFPGINSRVLDDSYVILKDINLGVAVDAPDGLVVPNIKRADALSLRGLAAAIDDVAARAKSGKITADDLAGCSFSVSNPGIRGNLFGGAIIAQPNAGILRMGEIQKRVVVVDVEGQDTMAIHPVMYLALSYDHRIIDGVLGNSFLYRVAEILEKGEFEV